MCRYAYHQYKDHFACFNCRKTFKKWLWPEKFNPSSQTKQTLVCEQREIACPDCGEVMANMGLDFKAPKRSEAEAWKVIEILYDEGYAFHGCGCDAGGYIPPTKLKDVPSFKEKHNKKSPGEELLSKVQKKNLP